jgi:ketosteroid isomerase-like protein
MSVDENKRIARELLEALGRADTKKVLELYAEDFELWTPGNLPFSGIHTREEIAPMMDGILGAFPAGLSFAITGMTAEGDRVAVEAESRGEHASGELYHNRYHFLLVIRDGRIRRLKEYMDTLHAREVLVEGAAALRS